MNTSKKPGVVVLNPPNKKIRFNPDLKNTMSSVVGGAGEASQPATGAVSGAGAVMASVEGGVALESITKFLYFMECIADESNVDSLIPIMEGYCVVHGINNTVLTEASFNEFARKHGGKVKAFMAGLMLLASVAHGADHKQVDTGHGNPYGGKAPTQMTSGGDGDAEGHADAQKLLNLLKSDKVDNNEMAKQFDHMKSHAGDDGYMKALKGDMQKAGIDVSKVFSATGGDNTDSHSHDNSHKDAKHMDTTKINNMLKQHSESNDEATAQSMGQDSLRQAGLTGYSISTQQLPNGNYVAVVN